MLLGNSLMAKAPAAGGEGPGNNEYSNAIVLADFRNYNGGVVDKEVHWLVGKEIEHVAQSELDAEYEINAVTGVYGARPISGIASNTYDIHRLQDDSWITEDNLVLDLWYIEASRDYYPFFGSYFREINQTLGADSVYDENSTYVRVRHHLQHDDGSAEEVGWLSDGGVGSYGHAKRITHRPRVTTGTYRTEFYALIGANGGRDLETALEHDLTANSNYTKTRFGSRIALRDNGFMCYAFGVWRAEDFPTNGLLDVLGEWDA